MREFGTPMMQQYTAIKKDYPDCLLFFRLGDFYELFLEDAIIGAKVLDIVLTRRPRGKDGDIPMAGVPFHAAEVYIAKLVKAGHKVAICEQVSEPTTRGLVQRDVVRIVTPGTILDEKTLIAHEHNYTISISRDKKNIGIAASDISTGEFRTTQFEHTPTNLAQILSDELARYRPSECILKRDEYDDPNFLKIISAYKEVNIFCCKEWDMYSENASRNLKRHFNVKTLRGFGLAEKPQAIEAAAVLLGYLGKTQKDRISHIKKITTYSPKDHVVLDASTISNLELFQTIREQNEFGSFVECIDETKTACGGRLLRQWIREPLRTKKTIEARYAAVEAFLHERSMRNTIRQLLDEMYDLERILSRLSVGIGTPPDLINLKESLRRILSIHQVASVCPSPLVQELIRDFPEHAELVDYIDKYIVTEPPFDPKEGGLINEKVDSELDELRESIRESKDWINALEGKERKRTGINSLKVKFNSVFGYYIEITRANVHLVPDNYIRKQTTINAERFVTPELEVYEEKVLRGQSKINSREYELFTQVITYILTKTELIQQTAENSATLDCLLSFATLAEKERYTRPSISEGSELIIEDGRHPVVEKIRETSFVPNNTLLNHDDHQLVVITGPNMAGKSVYMRQVALITLLAHIGSFVPAKRAQIPLVDRIFVRSGASDSIGRGLSTFMVEMVETAYILHHTTKDSLIIMDEIGRGTSTYDGISIAWAVAEYLVTHPDHAAKTLFATHYHELQKLEERYPDHIKNYHMAIEEAHGMPHFLYRIIRGGAEGSYAIAVARLAGVPEEVTKRASELLSSFGSSQDSRFISPSSL